jgi:cytidylate kinase
MPGVTISASYGAGGSVVAPRVAELLGLRLIDRAISSTVAKELNVTVEEAELGEARRSVAERFFGSLAPLAGAATTDFDPSLADDAAEFREHAEAIMRAALTGGCVILGRAGAAAFIEDPDVLRVRLFGSKEGRIAQGAVVEGISEEESRRRQPETDKARAHYMRRLYHADQDDPALYHLQLDSTVLPLTTCADVIATAYRAFDEARARPATGARGDAAKGDGAQGDGAQGDGAQVTDRA